MLRRYRALDPVHVGDLSIDPVRRRVVRGGHVVELAPREHDLLLALARAGGEVVTRAELLQEVWGVEGDPRTNVLEVHVSRLRKKLDRYGRPLIQNERGTGYRLLPRLGAAADGEH